MPASSLAGSRPGYQFRRVRSTEWMDEAGLDPALRAEALKGIERIGTWPGQRRPLLREILGLLGPPSKGLKLIEVGAGSGHLSRWVAQELSKRGYDAEVLPTDLHAHPGVGQLDCLDPQLPEADLYFSNLLLHHLKDEEASGMLSLLASKASLGFVHLTCNAAFFTTIWLNSAPSRQALP